jgi:hypothetical protein
MWGIECWILIPFILHFKKLDKSGKWVFYYLICSNVFAGGTKIIAQIWKNNLWFYNSMYFIQFIILSMFFRDIIRYKAIKQLTLIMILPVLAFVILDYTKLEGPNAYNTYATSTETFILIVYGSTYFWQLLRDEELVKQSIFINSLPNFWYNAGLFIYHCGYFLFSLCYNVFNTSARSAVRLTLAITFIAGIIQLILLYIGLLKAKKIRP